MSVYGSIAYAPMIESVNRKFARRKDVIGKNINFYMGGGTRINTYAGIGPVSKNYMFFRKFASSVTPTPEQVQLQEFFGYAASARAYILKDLTQIPSVNNLYKQAMEDKSKKISGVSAYGRSLRGWVFTVCYERIKDKSVTPEQLKQFPTAFDA